MLEGRNGGREEEREKNLIENLMVSRPSLNLTKFGVEGTGRHLSFLVDFPVQLMYNL